MYHMKHLDGVLELIDKEFGEMKQAGKFRSNEEVHITYEMIDIVKDIFCIWDYEAKWGEGIDDEYSEMGYMNWYPTYPDSRSHARGRGAKRDSMGRYSRDYEDHGMEMREPKDYSRTDAKSDYIDRLYSMMDKTTDERTRENLKKMIHDMEQQ